MLWDHRTVANSRKATFVWRCYYIRYRSSSGLVVSLNMSVFWTYGVHFGTSSSLGAPVAFVVPSLALSYLRQSLSLSFVTLT